MITLLKNFVNFIKINRYGKKKKNTKSKSGRIYFRIFTKPPDFMSSHGLR